MTNIDTSHMCLAHQLVGEDREETQQLMQLLAEANRFICEFSWVEKVERVYFGYGVADIVAIFFFQIVPKRDGVDPELWVVVGDIPPAYLVTDEARDPTFALRVYVREMAKWVDAVKSGRSVRDVIPVNVSPTLENARELERRLEFLQDEIVPRCEEDLRGR